MLKIAPIAGGDPPVRVAGTSGHDPNAGPRAKGPESNQIKPNQTESNHKKNILRT
jgi:hypothetical protein